MISKTDRLRIERVLYVCFFSSTLSLEIEMESTSAY